MTTLLLIVWFIVLVLLFLVLAIQPKRTRHSWNELKRRDDKLTIRREHLLGDIYALRRVVLGLLFVALVFIGVALWQIVGGVIAVGVWFVAGGIVRLRALHLFAMKLYESIEPRLLLLMERVPAIGMLFRDDKYIPHDQRVESVDHLLHLVDSAGHILSDEQQGIVRRSINWHSTRVDTIMTKVDDIVSVKHRELLGPLVLDDLHRSGYYRFPVTKSSIDDIVGILDITDLLDVSSTKKTEMAEDVMASDVLRIESDEKLPDALRLLQKSRQHMLIVVNETGKTAGIVTLADVAVSLFGKNRGKMVK